MHAKRTFPIARLALAGLALTTAFLSGCSKPEVDTAEVKTESPQESVASVTGQEPLKVGFVYVGPTGDAGWTYSHDKARQFMQAELGDKVKTTYVESVAEGADSERVINQLAKSGHQLIFTTSFGYMNPTLKVAKRYPDVKFEHSTGYKRADNVGTYFDRAYEGRYLTGMVAGLMTKNDTLGYVASFPIPEVVRGINAFTLGAQAVNPDVKVKVVWVSTWYDPGKEREAAETMILQGADVLTQHTDSPGVINAAEAQGVYAIGYHSDMSEYGKTAHLTATVHNWGPLYTRKAQAVLDGDWESEAFWGGFADETLSLAPFNDAVPEDVRSRVEAAKAALIAGELHPFHGPLNDRSGVEKLAAGSNLSDEDMLGMNWFVAGIEGELPQ
ncbi:BMP family ABC transporter substrate-binding protein [Microbulbifer bruguierae]|uniref:BMP family ABC transporter substrate-binding protein n=1 Tax=Microbulbifer bruguierae TaxID=3029061 RepID=A0ABY8N8F5_9GAMM|nr:BMP family ABC transporter substrate-binding protein [Microbulbifer bruguierae]WGL15180.1 BMP family ABC transporter substrate-binding protein [Microbulbifer bruguierae]